MKRVVLALVALALLVSPVVGAVATADVPATQETNARGGEMSVFSAAQSNNTTETPTQTPTPAQGGSTPASDGRPARSDTVRILPVQLEPEFMSVETAEQGQVYNTTGPFAIFSLSSEVETVAIQQPKASAQVLEGGRQVLVEYEGDAAPVGSQSLYQLQIYFHDGSSRTIDLYAERTSVDVGSAEMKKYRPLIMDILADAESNGYARDAEGAESHYQDVKDTAQLLDSLMIEQAKRLFGSIVGILMNPLGIAALLLIAALIAYWQLSRNGAALDILSNDSGKSARLREKLWLQYKKAQQTAAEEPLRELRGVGEMGEIYWRDAYGVDTTAGLAELFRQGLPVRRDGETKHVGGVNTLDVESIDGSWLEAVCRDHRLPSTEIALSHGKTALRRMISEYGMGHTYDDTYERVHELIDELDESRDVTRYAAESSGRSGAVAGGDD